MVDAQVAELLPELNRHVLPRATKDAILRLSNRAWMSLLEIAVDTRHADLQRVNAIGLLLELQIIGEPEERAARDRSELFGRLVGLATDGRKRVRSAAAVALVTMHEQARHGSLWPVVGSDMRDRVQAAVKGAIQLGLDKGSQQYLESWLAGVTL